MATFSSFGLLVLYIALSGAPAAAPQITVSFSEYQHQSFVKDTDGWWYRRDDLGTKVYYKCEGAKLLAGYSKDKTESTDLTTHFQITGKEDWSKPQKILSKISGQEVSTLPEKTRMAIRTIEGEKAVEINVTFQTAAD